MKEYTPKQIKQLAANPYTFKVTKNRFFFQRNLRRNFGFNIRQAIRRDELLKTLDMTYQSLDKSRLIVPFKR